MVVERSERNAQGNSQELPFSILMDEEKNDRNHYQECRKSANICRNTTAQKAI